MNKLKVEFKIGNKAQESKKICNQLFARDFILMR